mmetsp:Transcript_4392/g.7439  ORF Transcript_4392/g.7439 Transcript_4392/m.7439 type:complete len:98 (+) Transcript_4392:1565-1858(+)
MAVVVFAFGIWAKQTLTLTGASLFIFQVFTSEQAIVERGQEVYPMIVFIVVFNFWQSIVGGAMKGVGREQTRTLFSFFSFFMLAFPLGIYLAFYHSY